MPFPFILKRLFWGCFEEIKADEKEDDIWHPGGNWRRQIAICGENCRNPHEQDIGECEQYS
jgi:hypothetical protein